MRKFVTMRKALHMMLVLLAVSCLLGRISSQKPRRKRPRHHKMVTKKINSTYSVNVDFSSQIDYSFLKYDEVLLQTYTPERCNSEKLLCTESERTDQINNVSYYLSTRATSMIDPVWGEFRYFTIQTLFDWMIFPQGIAINYNAILKPIPHIQSSKQMRLYGQTTSDKPRTIFMFSQAIPYFASVILPQLTVPFVLYSGCTDYTVPYNVDLRYIPLFNVDYITGNEKLVHKSGNETYLYKSSWDTILESPLLLHWFVENRVLSHEKVSTMPIGMNPHENHPDDKSDHPEHIVPLTKRPLKVLQIDRIRPLVPQFRQREIVQDLCLKNRDTCVSVTQMTLHKEFIRHLTTYPFVLCVHGGGIDPSPKAWEALLLGTIPIIEHTPLDDAYSLFPVAFVNNITEFMLWENKTQVMTQWLQELGPHYEEGSKLREKVLEKLTTKYWWNKITSYLK